MALAQRTTSTADYILSKCLRSLFLIVFSDQKLMFDYSQYLPFLYTVGALVLTLWFLSNRRRTKYSTLPPGPPTKPIVGNLPQIKFSAEQGKERLRCIADLVSQYGRNGLATLYLGNKPTVFITKFETIKTVLNDDIMTGKPFNHSRDTFFKRKGLIFTEGKDWIEQRRFALNTLRNFGMGKSWLQDLIIEEAKELVNDIKKSNSRPISPESVLVPCVSNIICRITFGRRFSHEDVKFQRLAYLAGANIQNLARNQAVDAFPLLRFLPFSPFRARYLTYLKNSRELTEFLQNLIDEHRGPSPDEQPMDYIQAYMLEAERQKGNKTSTFTDFQLTRAIFSLFAAGSETTATTILWAFLYLLENPLVHAKVQVEVDEVIRDESYPTLDLKDRLPYTQACLFEVQRLSNTVAVVLRRVTENYKIDDYTIPPDVTVNLLISAVHEDPEYFCDPLTFKPERFLDESGALLTKVEGFIPYSIGKRLCLGESLARMELYIFFVTLVKHFHFHLAPGQQINSNDSLLGLVHWPKPFQVIFEPR